MTTLVSKMKHYRKLPYRIFVILMLVFAIYFTNQSIRTWQKAPIVVSVDTKSINELAFPSISICHPWSWTWPNIVNMLDYFDQEELVKDALARNFMFKFKGYLCCRFKTTSDCQNLFKNFTLKEDGSNDTVGKSHSYFLIHFYIYQEFEFLLNFKNGSSSKCGDYEVMNKVQEMQLAFSLSALLSNGSRKLDFDYWFNNIERNTFNTLCLEQKQNNNRRLFEEWSTMLESLSDYDYANFQPTKICSLQSSLPIKVKEWCNSCWYPNKHKCLNECSDLDGIVKKFLKDDCIFVVYDRNRNFHRNRNRTETETFLPKPNRNITYFS